MKRSGCWCMVLLGLLALEARGGEKFFLKAMPSQRMFGPYTFDHGGTVTVGKVTFEIVRKLDPPAPSRHPAAERAAQAAAEAWLRLIDQEVFGAAWEAGSSYLRQAVPQVNFEESLRAIQTTLGATRSRTLSSVAYSTTLPSAPDGQYVVMQFDVVRERKEQAVESVIATLDADGRWRIAGYYVR